MPAPIDSRTLQEFLKAYSGDGSLHSGKADTIAVALPGTSIKDNFFALSQAAHFANSSNTTALWQKFQSDEQVFKLLIKVMQERVDAFPSEYKSGLARLLLWSVETAEDAKIVLESLLPLAEQTTPATSTPNSNKTKLFDAVCDGIALLHSQATQQSLALTTNRVIQICQKFFERMPEATFTATALECTEVILKYSTEPEADLRPVLEGTPIPSGFTPARLREYYQSGHSFIGHHSHFGPYYHTDAVPEVSTREVHIRNELARLRHYPSLEIQDDWAQTLAKVPESLEHAFLTLTGKFSEANLTYHNLTSLVRAAGAENLDCNALTSMIRHLAQIEEKELLPACVVLEELCEHFPATLAEHIAQFKLGNYQMQEVQLYAQRLQTLRIKYPEKPLLEVIEAFRRKESPDSEVPPESALLKASLQYDRILRRGEELVTMNATTLSECVQRLHKASAQHKGSETQMVEYYALAREIVRRRYGIHPYNTQLIAALILSNEELLHTDTSYKKGISAQVKTGEGKSILFAMLAGYQALQGNSVDVITSNLYLARKGAELHKEFFKDLGLRVGYHEYNSFERTDTNPQQKPHIVYSTSADLIFSLLNKLLKSTKSTDLRPQQVLLVDEADNLCLDTIVETCRIARSIPRPFDERTMRYIADKVKHGATKSEILTSITSNTSPAIAEAYVDSAFAALQKIEGRDYVVKDGQVQIINWENTGRVRASLRWENGLHEFLEIKHGLRLSPSNGVAALMGHSTFINRYTKLICITGTLGSAFERQAMRQIYNLAPGFDVPSHIPSQRKDLPTRFFKNDAECQFAILTDIGRITDSENSRPVLLAAETVAASEKLHKLVTSGNRAQLLNDVTNTDKNGKAQEEDVLVSQIGTPGLITVGTSVVGRGIDAKMSAEVCNAGGLHVIANGIPHSPRVEYQLRGRSGRQGQPGSSQLYVSLSSDSLVGKYVPHPEEIVDLIKQGTDPDAIKRFLQKMSLIDERSAIRNRLTKEAEAQELFEHYLSKYQTALDAVNEANPIMQENPHILSQVARTATALAWTRIFSEFNTRLNRTPLANNYEKSTQDLAELKKCFEEEFNPNQDSQGVMRDVFERFRMQYAFKSFSLENAPNQLHALKDEYKKNIDALFQEFVERFRNASLSQINTFLSQNVLS